jgi:hypothetical protein
MVLVRGQGDKGVDEIPLSNSGLCLPNGTPANMGPVSHEYVYSPGRVTILLENSEIRRIWTDGRGHVPDEQSNPSFSGDSIGHWEGDTLVVETTNIFPEAELFIGQNVTAKTVVKERITLAEKDKLRIDTVVEDTELLQSPGPTPVGTTVKTARRSTTRLLLPATERQRRWPFAGIDFTVRTAARRTEMGPIRWSGRSRPRRVDVGVAATPAFAHHSWPVTWPRRRDHGRRQQMGMVQPHCWLCGRRRA